MKVRDFCPHSVKKTHGTKQLSNLKETPDQKKRLQLNSNNVTAEEEQNEIELPLIM